MRRSKIGPLLLGSLLGPLLVLLAMRAAAGERVEMPLEHRVPVAVLALQLPPGSVVEGEQASAQIAFTVDLRGRVVESRLLTASTPAFGEALLPQHRQWVYAIATRNDDCTAVAFRGTQRIVVQRKDGKWRMDLAPAVVTELHERARFDSVSDSALVPSYEEVVSRMRYPGSALRNGIEASFALLVEFDANGKVVDAAPINAAYDDYGFVQAALKEARRLQADTGLTQGRPWTACMPIRFRIR
jgi:hypothetical protein